MAIPVALVIGLLDAAVQTGTATSRYYEARRRLKRMEEAGVVTDDDLAHLGRLSDTLLEDIHAQTTEGRKNGSP